MTVAGGVFLPSVDFSSPAPVSTPTTDSSAYSTPTPGEVNSVATSAAAQQAQAAAINSVLPVLYGTVRKGALLADIAEYGASLVLFCLWSHGPIGGVVSYTIDDADPPSGTVATHYDGTQVSPDPTLVLVYGSGYADILSGVAYSVIVVPAGASQGFPTVTAIINGRKTYDPRTETSVFSPNAALALADFLSSTEYGEGRSVNTATIIAAADADDEILGTAPNTQPRRTLNLALDTRQEAAQWRKVLAMYAGCTVLDDGEELRLVPDRPSTLIDHYRHTDGRIRSLSSLKLSGIADVPTVVEIIWTDPSVIPWRDRSAMVSAAGVSTGELPLRLSTIRMPGINSYGQAVREATERLNKLTLGDLSCDLEVFDEGFALEPGDRIQVTHPAGLTAKDFRIGKITGELGRYTLALTEYDEAMWSDDVVSLASTPDTALPNPLAPPALSGLSSAEEVFQMQNGLWSSRIVASWTAPTWAYLVGYRVELYDGPDLIESATVTGPVWRSGPVKEAVVYTVRVAALSTLSAGEWTSSSLTPAGKYLLPSDVPSLTGFEVGGEARLTIGASTDLDQTGYEVRYGPVGCSWDLSSSVKFVNFVPAASGVGGYVVYKDAPAGTWDFMACSLDSIGQYSATPARLTLTITTDANSFLLDNHDFSAGSPTLSNMQEYSLPCDPSRYFVTEDNVAFGTKFSGAMSTYTNALATYHSSISSEFKTAAYDFGQSLVGNWSGSLSSSALSGSKTDVISLSADGTSYSDASGLTAKTSGRFGKLKSSASGSSTLLISMPEAKLRIDAVPRVEYGQVTTSATLATTVTLDADVAAFKAILLTPVGTSPIHAVVDAVTTGSPSSFDIYAFNTAGAQVAAPVMWQSQGV